jgi:26S proteasome regulatory subunit N1
MKRQLAFLLARAQIPIERLRAPSENLDEEINIEDEFPEDLRECLSGTRMSTHFRDFGKELGVTDPKSLEAVYKTHLENIRMSTFLFNFCGG